jgi:hypothetical protein
MIKQKISKPDSDSIADKQWMGQNIRKAKSFLVSRTRGLNLDDPYEFEKRSEQLMKRYGISPLRRKSRRANKKKS